MYPKISQRNIWKFIFLTVVGVLLTSCLQTGQAGELPTLTPRPTQRLRGAAQAGPLLELTQVNELLLNVPVSQFLVNGDVALAVAEENGSMTLIAINLRRGEIANLADTSIAKNDWAIAERYFAWIASNTSGDTSVKRVHVYDVSTGEMFVVGESNSQRWPAVSGKMIVWAELQGSNGWDIYAYDMSSATLIPVVTRPFIQMHPKVAGDWVIYLEDQHNDPRNPMQAIYLHNLVTGEDMLIGPSPYAANLEGDTYGIGNGRVVWKGWAIGETPAANGPPPTLRRYDLETRTESVLDLSPVCSSVPVSFKMTGDLILFSCEGFYGCYDLGQEIFFEVPYPDSGGDTYLSETYVVFQVQVEEGSFWDYMTPGASPLPPAEHWLTPQPARFRLLVVPIIR